MLIIISFIKIVFFAELIEHIDLFMPRAITLQDAKVSLLLPNFNLRSKQSQKVFDVRVELTEPQRFFDLAPTAAPSAVACLQITALRIRTVGKHQPD